MQKLLFAIILIGCVVTYVGAHLYHQKSIKTDTAAIIIACGITMAIGGAYANDLVAQH